MGNTENLKNTISSIDDETLRLKIDGIMQALGIAPSAMGQRFSDVSVIRNAVMNMSEQDINNILNSIGAQKAEALLREINKK